MAADTTRHAASDSLTLFLFFLSVSLSPFIYLPIVSFLPPSLPHALLCEGIEFIRERWAGHTTTINSLSLSLCLTHTKVKLLTTVCQMNQTSPLCPFVSYRVHFQWKLVEKEKRQVCFTQTHTHTQTVPRGTTFQYTPPGVRVCSHGDHFPKSNGT